MTKSQLFSKCQVFTWTGLCTLCAQLHHNCTEPIKSIGITIKTPNKSILLLGIGPRLGEI